MPAGRFVYPATATLREPNRPALSRELLAILGSERDLDPDALLYCVDGTRDDWTRYGGATLEGSGSRGAVELGSSVLLLDAQGEGAYAVQPTSVRLPQGSYVLRVRAKDSNQVASDLKVKVYNQTDAVDVLAFTAFSALSSTYGIKEIGFTVNASDAGDELRFYVEKATASANAIRVDYAAIHPSDARRLPFGEVPPLGEIVFTRSGGAGTKVTSHTIKDATGGRTVETATYSYTGDRLDSITYDRGGRTATKTFIYSGDDCTNIRWS